MLSFLMNHISALVMESLSLLLRPIVDATVFDPWPCQCEAKVMPPMRHLEDRCALASAREADWIELRSKLKPLDWSLAYGLLPLPSRCGSMIDGVWSAPLRNSRNLHFVGEECYSVLQLLAQNHPQPLNICIFVYFTWFPTRNSSNQCAHWAPNLLVTLWQQQEEGQNLVPNQAKHVSNC